MRRFEVSGQEMIVAKDKQELISQPSSVEEELVLIERGEDAVLHRDHLRRGRGRRSILFPDLNITATAERLGITKSHLAKVLTGQNKPSLALAKKLADVLNVDLAFVALLGDNVIADEPKPPTKKTRKRNRNAESYPGV
jgi:DNA-binding XRE family transcriptional regulator